MFISVNILNLQLTNKLYHLSLTTRWMEKLKMIRSKDGDYSYQNLHSTFSIDQGQRIWGRDIWA